MNKVPPSISCDTNCQQICHRSSTNGNYIYHKPCDIHHQLSQKLTYIWDTCLHFQGLCQSLNHLCCGICTPHVLEGHTYYNMIVCIFNIRQFYYSCLCTQSCLILTRNQQLDKRIISLYFRPQLAPVKISYTFSKSFVK